MELFLAADIIGIIAFSISGFLVALRNQLDLLGIVISASLTALGGGILRDVILDKTPFAFEHFYPAATMLLTIVVAFLFKRYQHYDIEKKWLFVISDTIGLVAFSIAGALLAIDAGYNFFGIIILSFMTAIGGGISRDILLNQVPSVLISDFYGSIALITSILLIILQSMQSINEISLALVSIAAISLRLIAYKQKWQLPVLK
jgi:uncharacterized membrane protein YeiH